MNLQYFLSVDGFITGIITLIFGLIVLSKNKSSRVNQTLFLLTLATAFWSLAYWRWLLIYDNKDSAIFWVRILSIGSTFIPVFYFHWIAHLLEVSKKNRIIILISYFLSFVCLIFSFSPLFIKNVEPLAGFSFWPQAGILYTLYLIFIYFSLVVYSIFLLFKYYKVSFGSRKEQIKYVLLGSILGFGGGATNFFLWYKIDILPLGNVFVVLYPVLFSYAIVKHHLMDVKFTLRKSSVFLISFIAVLVPTVLFLRFFDNAYPEVSLFFSIFILMLALIVYPKANAFFFKFSNKYFFTSLYDPRDAIKKISFLLKDTLNVEEVYDVICNTAKETFHAKTSGVLIYDEDMKSYRLDRNNGFDIGDAKEFKISPFFDKELIAKAEPIFIEDLIHDPIIYAKTKKIVDFLLAKKVELLSPLNLKGKTVGLIVLGQKDSGDMYNSDDISVLGVMSSQAAISIENGFLFKEVKDFNVKLQGEVDKATADLRQANEDLEKMNKSKSEFISIASHQLRTPLTSIKGYTAMVLDGDYGEVSDRAHEAIKRVFVSCERLIRLVEHLLNVSRIESGRIEYSISLMDIGEVANQTAYEMAVPAEMKQLVLEYTPVKKGELMAEIDPDKIKEVMMNFVDNAIKYTKAGKIEMSIASDGKNIRFKVKDSGEGITPEDKKKLFLKFSRGEATAVSHPEGTGLGLYVAKQIIEAHKGNVYAESEGHSKGSVFYFDLPAAAVEANNNVIAKPAPVKAVPKKTAGKKAVKK